MPSPLRFSVLRQMGRSPAHALYAMTHEPPDTPAMRLGRLAHAIVLGTPTGPVWSGERRGKVWADFKDQHQGEDIVTDSEYSTATEIAAAINANPEAHALIAETPDQPMFFERTLHFDFAGRACRATPDVFDALTLTELKSTADASPMRFPFHAMRMGYHAQLAWQKDAIRASGLPVPERLSIVAVETKPPYAVAVFGVTPRAEDFGRRLYRSWIEQFLVCEASNDWPSYGPGVIDAPEDFELVGADGEILEAAEEEVAVTNGDGLEQGELPLIGLPPPLSKGIMPSKLTASEAVALAARRKQLEQQQAESERGGL